MLTLYDELDWNLDIELLSVLALESVKNAWAQRKLCRSETNTACKELFNST